MWKCVRVAGAVTVPLALMLALSIGCADSEDTKEEGSGNGACCKCCGANSKACGDSCISNSSTCNVGSGCACECSNLTAGTDLVMNQSGEVCTP